MSLHRAGRARVIPILLRPVLWEGTLLAQLKGLPENGQPITTWANQDQAFHQIASHLADIVCEQLHLNPLQAQDWQTLTPPLLQESVLHPQSLYRCIFFRASNPYRGLRAFAIENAKDFFGRDQLIAEMLQAFQKAISFSSQSGSTRLLS